MKPLIQALAGAAVLAAAVAPAHAGSASSTMSVSVKVVAPGSLSGAVAGPDSGQGMLVTPTAAETPKAPETGTSAAPEGTAAQPK